MPHKSCKLGEVKKRYKYICHIGTVLFNSHIFFDIKLEFLWGGDVVHRQHKKKMSLQTRTCDSNF